MNKQQVCLNCGESIPHKSINGRSYREPKMKKNYFDNFNNVQTEKEMLEVVRNLPIGQFRALVKAVGEVVNEFSKMTDNETQEEAENWHKRETPRCKSSYEPWVDENTGKIITHLPKPNDGEKVLKAG